MPCGGPRKRPLQLHVAGLSRSARDGGDDCMPLSNLDRLCAPSRAGRGRGRGRQCPVTVVHPWTAQSSSPAALAASACQIMARARELRTRWCRGPDVRHFLPAQKVRARMRKASGRWHPPCCSFLRLRTVVAQRPKPPRRASPPRARSTACASSCSHLVDPELRPAMCSSVVLYQFLVYTTGSAHGQALLSICTSDRMRAQTTRPSHTNPQTCSAQAGQMHQ
jgi:hypothetical protein